MRIIYPEELNKEYDMFRPYVERVDFDKVVFKKDTPEKIKKHYEHWLLETKRLEGKIS